jgi:hypothetical protein
MEFLNDFDICNNCAVPWSGIAHSLVILDQAVTSYSQKIIPFLISHKAMQCLTVTELSSTALFNLCIRELA